jgi:hypothetical protein
MDYSRLILKSIYITQDITITFTLPTHIVNYLSDTEVTYYGIIIFTLPKPPNPSITSSEDCGSAY